MTRIIKKLSDVTSGTNITDHKYDSGNDYSTLSDSTNSNISKARYISDETYIISSTPRIRKQNDIYKLNQKLKKLGK